MAKKWLVWSTQRTYEVDGTEEEAESVRRHQANRHQAVFKKAEATPRGREEMRAWKEKHAPKVLAFAVVLAILFSPAAYAQLGPGNPPPGANDFRAMSKRAEWVRDSVLKVAPNANGRCVYAVALELVGLAELAWSDDVVARGNRPRTVRKGEAEAFKKSLRDNARNECEDWRGPPGSGGMYETVRGLLSFAAVEDRWIASSYERLKTDVWNAAEALVKLGAFVPVAEGAAALPAGIALPVLDPTLFMPRRADPNDGT